MMSEDDYSERACLFQRLASMSTGVLELEAEAECVAES